MQTRAVTHGKTCAELRKVFQHIQHKLDNMAYTKKLKNLLALHIHTEAWAARCAEFKQKQYNIDTTIIAMYLTPQTTAALCAHLHNNLNCIHKHFL